MDSFSENATELKLLEMDQAASAISNQLQSMEDDNRLKSFELKKETRRVRIAETEARRLRDDVIPLKQLDLLRARKAGDEFESERLESELEERQLKERLAHSTHLHKLMSESTVSSLVVIERSEATRSHHLAGMRDFR